MRASAGNRRRFLCRSIRTFMIGNETPTLEEYGVNRKAFFDVSEKMAHDAMESGSPQNTRRPITGEITKSYR